jgi:putative membrane protein
MLLTDADRARIVQAIAQAETRTSGEIYCVICRASGEYIVYPVGWSAAASLLVPLPAIYLTAWPAIAIYALQLLVFGIVLLVLSNEHLRYRLVPASVRKSSAHERAVGQFAAHGLQHTELRTGVLIFVSVAERYAEVIADTGIASKVPNAVWDEVVEFLTSAIAAKRPGDGFVMAIEKCTDHLAEHFPPGAINRNELPNAIVEL